VSRANDFDLMVVGGGPGGYTAAIRASQLGLNTALIERDALGGVCLNWGCIPTKALLECAELINDIRGAQRFGIDATLNSIDLAKIVGHSRKTADGLSAGVAWLLKKNGITHIVGEARLTEKGRLTVTPPQGSAREYRTPHTVLATGATLRSLPGTPDDPRIWSAREAMVPDAVPDTLTVIGAGAIGVEFASFYADLGTRVTLVEAAERIVPAEDPDISHHLEKSLAARGITCLTGTGFERVDPDESGLTVHLHSVGDTKPIRCDRLLIAVGVTANTADLGLEKLGVTLDRGFIAVDDFGATNVAGVYAIGDVAGPPWLAHKAAHEGTACVEKIAGLDPVAIARRAIPGCIYARPQVASIGLNEADATASGLTVRIGRFNLKANGKALASGHADGFTKVLVDSETGELLGAHMIGHGVSEQIQGFAVALGAELTDSELEATVFPHPTQSESIHEAVLDAAGIAINH